MILTDWQEYDNYSDAAMLVSYAILDKVNTLTHAEYTLLKRVYNAIKVNQNDSSPLPNDTLPNKAWNGKRVS